MGFSLGGFLGAAITPANEVMAARAGAQAQANQRQQQMALEMYAMQRQAEQLGMQRALQNSEISKNASLARSADALADYRTSGGPMSVQWYTGDNGEPVPMVTRAPTSFFKNGGLNAGGPTPQQQGGPQGQPPAFAAPTTSDLTSSLRGGPQSSQGGPPGQQQSPTPPVTPPGAPVATRPRIVSKLGATPPATRYQQANGQLNGADWRGVFDPTKGQYGTLTNGQFQPIDMSNFKPYAPPVQPAIVVGQDSTGQHVYRVPKAGGPAEAVPGIAPKAAGPGANTGAQTSLADLLRTHDALTDLENDPTFHVSFVQQMREGANYGIRQHQIKGESPGVGQLAIGGLLDATTNPDERQVSYMQNGRFFGEDASNAWKGRTNEERVIRDINTGTLNSSNDDMPTVRTGVQARRQNVIAMTALANPAQFNALDPARKAQIQGFINNLPPDKRAAAMQAARDAAGGPAQPAATAAPATKAPAPKGGSGDYGIFGGAKPPAGE